MSFQTLFFQIMPFQTIFSDNVFSDFDYSDFAEYVFHVSTILAKPYHISQLFAAIEELSKHGQVFFDMRYTSELKSTQHPFEKNVLSI